MGKEAQWSRNGVYSSVFADSVLKLGAESEPDVSGSVSACVENSYTYSVTADLHVSADTNKLTFFFIDGYMLYQKILSCSIICQSAGH